VTKKVSKKIFKENILRGEKRKKLMTKKFEPENFQISSKKAKQIINKITIVRKTSQI